MKFPFLKRKIFNETNENDLWTRNISDSNLIEPLNLCDKSLSSISKSCILQIQFQLRPGFGLLIWPHSNEARS